MNQTERQPFLKQLMINISTDPGRAAFSDGTETMTYAELNIYSGRVYRYLKEKGYGPEDFIMVCLPRGVAVFAVCIGIWRAGAAYVICEEGQPTEKTDYIYRDCGCKLKITGEILKETEVCKPLEGYEECGEHTAAYAAYTSGSTGNPKGVLHEIGTLVNCRKSFRYHGKPIYQPDDRFALLSPLNFAASTMIMHPVIYAGAELVIVPYADVKDPARLKNFFAQNRITVSFLTPSLVRVFHDFNPEMRTLFLSSEPASQIYFDGLTIYNVHGQTETGSLTTVFRVDRPYEVTPIGVSQIDEVAVKVLRDNGEECAPGEMGEMCLNNDFFREYIHLPEMTEYVFRGGTYHTGDIGRYNENGDIVLAGRNDDMVKINGNRVEPAEIEAAAKQVLGVNWCAARAFVKPERSYVCVYYKDDIQVDEEAAIRQMSEKLPYYMVPACFLKIDRIPVNANGKMNRKALPEPEILAQEGEYIAPETERETQICEAFAHVLGLSRVSVTDDFYRIGGDSLKTIRLMSEAGMEGISATDVFRERTARALAALSERKPEDALTPEQVREKEAKAREKAWRLTPAEQDFYDIQKRNPESLMWVIPVLYAFPPETETKLKAAAEAMMRNHPIFSTVLTEGEDGKIRQEYRPETLAELCTEEGTEEEIAEIRRTLKDPDLPFKLTGHPLAKVRLIRTEKRIYLYLLIHHIMTDGMGIQAILRTLRAAYQGEELTPDGYFSWLEAEEQAEGSPEWEKAREKMEALYSGTEWTSQLPTEGREPGEENTVVGNFIPMTEEEILALEQETGLSRTGLCAAVMMTALARQTGKRDILINWVFSNRGNDWLDAISGMMIRSLALGIRFDRFETMGDVYAKIREQMLANITNSTYEWCLHHPPENGEDRLFFVYEGEITSFDTLRDIGGEMIPVMMSNQAVVHSMSAQVINWAKDGQPGMLLACYCNKNQFDEAETAKFKTIMKEVALLILKTPDSRERTVKGILNA